MARLRALKLILHDLCFNLEVAELIAQTLRLDTERFALQLADLYFFFQHHGALDCDVEFGFEVFEGGGGVAGLALKIVVGDFDIAEFQLERSI